MFLFQVKNLPDVLINLAPLLNDNCPDYVRNFAAESFAFVARRVKDRYKFLFLVLQTVQQHPEVSEMNFNLLRECSGDSYFGDSTVSCYSVVGKQGTILKYG